MYNKKSNRIRNFKIQVCTCESPSLTMPTISNALEDVKSSSDLVYHYMDFLTKLFLCILLMLTVFLNVRHNNDITSKHFEKAHLGIGLS